MAIIITENFTGKRFGTASGAWTAARAYTVTGTLDESAAVSACGNIGDPHPQNPAMFLFEREATPKGGPLSWTVTCSYRFGDPGLGKANPCDEPAEIMPSLEHESVPFEFDLDGNAVANPNGDPYDPPDNRFIQSASFTLRRWVPFYDLNVALALQDHVNDAPVTIAKFGTADTKSVICNHYRPTDAYKSSAPYLRVEARVTVKPGVDPWQPRRVSKGRFGFFKSDAGPVMKGRIGIAATPGGGGDPIDFDVLLDGQGVPLDKRFCILIPPYNNSSKAPVANPAVPGNIVIDQKLSSATCTILIGKQVPTADFSALF